MSRKNKSKNRGRTTRKTRSTRRAARRETGKFKDAKTSLEARLLEPLAEIERIFNQLHHRLWFRPSGWDWPDLRDLFDTRVPSVDVEDRDKAIIVTAEVPGIEKDDLEISVSNRILTIKGASSEDEKTEEGDAQRREIQRNSFCRTLTLPAEIDGSKVRAECKDGILKLVLPKLPGSKAHDIPVT